MRTEVLIAVAMTGLTLIAGCASPSRSPTMSTEGSMLVRTAYVSEVRDITVKGGQDSGIGSAVGAILGGIAGSSVGSGHGRTVAAIGGALAGGVAGQTLEQAGATRSEVELRLRFDSGDVRSYRVDSGADFRVGETVKVITGKGETRITR
jgi:outer membrane lipoprotein SlyB